MPSSKSASRTIQSSPGITDAVSRARAWHPLTRFFPRAFSVAKDFPEIVLPSAPSVIADSMEQMRKRGRTLRCPLPDKQQRFFHAGADRCVRPIILAGSRPPHGVRHSHAPVNQRFRISRREAEQLLAKGPGRPTSRWSLARRGIGVSEAKTPLRISHARPNFCGRVFVFYG